MHKFISNRKTRATAAFAGLSTLAVSSAHAALPAGVESSLTGLIADVAIVGGIAVGIAVSIATFFIVKRVISRM